MTKAEANKAVVDNGYDWYIVKYENGEYDLKHHTQLSAILDCNEPKEKYGITDMQQCYNGEDFGELEF